jgi:hypothetical protein
MSGRRDIRHPPFSTRRNVPSLKPGTHIHAAPPGGRFQDLPSSRYMARAEESSSMERRKSRVIAATAPQERQIFTADRRKLREFGSQGLNAGPRAELHANLPKSASRATTRRNPRIMTIFTELVVWS